MATESKPSVYRYGIELPGNRLIFNPGTTAQRPSVPENGLTRLNSDIGALEFYIDNKWISVATEATVIQNAVSESFTATAGNIYPVSGTDMKVTLPASPAVGQAVTLFDNASSLHVNPVTVLRNGNKINGLASNYVLDRGNDVITFTFRGTSYGWDTLHTKPAAAVVSERFTGVVELTETTPIDIPVNKLIELNLAPHQTVSLTAREGTFGDEIHLLCVNNAGTGSVPAASIVVEAGKTINGITNASLTLGGKSSWIKLKYLDGWKVIGQSKEGVLLVGMSLNDTIFKSPGRYYIDAVDGGLPDGVDTGTAVLLEVIEGRSFSNASTVTEALQRIYIPTLKRKWERYGSDTWEQVSGINTVTSGALGVSVESNTHVRSTSNGRLDVTVTGTPIHGDRLSLTTGTGSTSEILLNVLKVNGVEVNGYHVTSSSRTVGLRYDSVTSSWFVESDSNPLLIAANSIVNNLLSYDKLSLRGRKHFVNATGDLPSKVVPGSNELIVRTTTRADASMVNNNSGILGLVDLLDCNTGDRWIRRFDEQGFTSGWRIQGGAVVITLDDASVPTNTHAVSYPSADNVLICQKTENFTLDFGSKLSEARPGDRFLIRNTTSAVLTVTDIVVLNKSHAVEENPNTISGEGDITAFLDNDKRLVIITSNSLS